MLTVHRVEIRPFFCPIEPVMHADVAAVEQRALGWAAATGLCPSERDRERLAGTRSAEFYGGMTPDGLVDNLEIAAEWVYWGFAFDDAWCDEEPARSRPELFVREAERALRVIETGDARLCAGDRYLAPLRDLAVRYRDRATSVQLRRWIEANRLWLFGVVRQNTYRSRGMALGLDDYLAVRLHDCGGPPTQSMYEFVNAAEVPAHEMDSPAVRAVTEAMWMIAAWDNDRVSRYKELLGERDDYNIVDVLRREHGWSAERASDAAVALRDRTMCLFLRLRERLMRHASTPLRRYLDALGHGIRSNIDWSLRVPRYGTVWGGEGDAPVARIDLTADVVGMPADDSRAAPAYPAIAWWWDELDRLAA